MEGAPATLEPTTAAVPVKPVQSFGDLARGLTAFLTATVSEDRRRLPFSPKKLVRLEI
jgi:hypothetical protein